MNKFFYFLNGPSGILLNILGLKFGYKVWGNCFSPAVCLDNYVTNPRGAANPVRVLTLIFRTSHGTETKFILRTDFNFEWSFKWNSDHLARKFGTFHETDFGGYYRWRNHIDL